MKPGSKGWKKFMAKLYGIGAAIVIVGALFKIEHLPGASLMLSIGLGTEAIIFLFSAFEPIHQDPDWELVYPELALGHSDELDHEGLPMARGGRGGTGVTEYLDKMLEEAKIDSALLERLGDGMRALGDNAAQLKGVTSAVVATDSYVSSLNSAAEKVSTLSESYEKASVSISRMTAAQAEGESFGEQMQKVSKNLGSLNNIYELQLKGSTAHLEATEKFQGQVTKLMEDLSASAEDTRLYKENMATLAQNLSNLNTIYGNMLKAMTVTKA